MNRTLFFIILVGFFFSFTNVSSNPFSGGGEAQHQNFETGKEVKNTLLLKITVMQEKLKQRLSKLIIDFKRGDSCLPFFLILMFSFIYGILHAAGPGHGKAFAAAYILSEKPDLTKGLVFGTSIAFFHGISGAFLVLILNMILKKTIAGNVAEVEYFTKITSFSLLSLLGFVLVLKGVAELFFTNLKNNSRFTKNIFVWGFSAGMIPCPGVIMIMLFCLSLGMPWFGFVLSIAVSAGMAVTISLSVILIALGKRISYRFISEEGIEKIETGLGLVSGGFVMCAGILLLLSSISTGRFLI